MPSDLRTVDLNLLKAFDALLIEGTVTRAAAKIGVSQPAMSAALHRLRALFGDQLFVRTPGGMEQTARAKELAIPIQRALRNLEAALNSPLTFDPITFRGTFVLGVTEYAEIALVESLANVIQKHTQHIDVRLRTTARNDFTELLDDGSIDAFIGHAQEIPSRFASKLLLHDPLVLLARRGHPIFKSELSLSSLVKWPQLLVSPTGDAQGPVDALLKRHNLERRVAMTVGTYLSVPLALQSSDMTANVPAQLANRLSKGMPLQTAALPFQHVVSSTLVWHRRNDGDQPREWLRAIIQDTANRHSGNTKDANTPISVPK